MPPQPGVPAEVQEILEWWLQPRKSTWFPFRVRIEPSRVVPGLVYYRGLYIPPGVMHGMHSVVVAARGDSSRVPVRTATDWFLAAGGSVPPTSEGAADACVEMVRQTDRFGEPLIVYTGPETLERNRRLLPGGGGSLADTLAARGGPPAAERAGEAGWTARFWAIQPGDVYGYECRLGPGGASMLARDTIFGLGIMVR